MVVERAGRYSEGTLLVMERGEREVDMLDVRECGLDVTARELGYSERRGGSHCVCKNISIATASRVSGLAFYGRLELGLAMEGM